MTKLILFVTTLALAYGLGAQAKTDIRFEEDVLPETKTQMLNDLALLGSMEGRSETPLHQKVFGKMNGAAYQHWLNTRVKLIGYKDCGEGAIACVDEQYDNQIWITKYYPNSKFPTIARLGVLFHEARHMEKDHAQWPHAICPSPFLDDHGKDVVSIWTGDMLQDEDACDKTPFGSYGIQTIFLKNVGLYCANCTSKVKADADLYANDLINRIIDLKAKELMKKDFKF